MQKSKILALLLAVVMVASMMVVPASAAAVSCACGKENPTWVELVNGDYIGSKYKDTDHHVYLTGDFTPAQWRQSSEYDTCIDLRGYTWNGVAEENGVNAEVFRISGGKKYSIISTVNGGKVVSNGTYSNAEGGVIYVGKGNSSLYCENITIAGGKFDAAVEGTTKGGNIYINAEGKVNLKNCVIEGGTANLGENIYAEGALTMAGCEVKDGNVVVTATGTLTLEGDVTVEDLVLQGTLDLKGHTLTVTGTMDDTNGTVTDSVGGGKVTAPVKAETWDGTSNIETGAYALEKDVTVSGDVAIKGTLDLKGYTLTVTGKLDASKGQIIDSTGKGKLVGIDKVTLNAENEALPLTAGDKTVAFETVTLKQGYLGKKYAAGADTVSYAFYVNKTASKTKVDEAIAAGTVKLEVYVKYNNGTADAEQVFELTADQITAYTASANWNGKMLCLTLTDLANVTVLEINARLVANGVTID